MGRGTVMEGRGPSPPMDKRTRSAGQRSTELALGLEEKWVKRQGSDFHAKGPVYPVPKT